MNIKITKNDNIKLPIAKKYIEEDVNIIVDVKPTLQEKTITPTKESQDLLPDADYVGMSKVIVNPIPEQYIIPNGTLNIITTDEYDVTDYSKAKIVEPNLIPENILEGVTILGVVGKLSDIKNAEKWTLTLNDGTEITKDVYIK